MRAATLRHRIEIYNKVLTDDGYSGDVVTWKSIGVRWANVEKTVGNESFSNGKTTWVSNYTIEVRDNLGIDWSTEQVIKYEGQIIWVRGFADKKQQGNRLYLLGVRGSPSDFPDNLPVGVFDQLGVAAYAQTGLPFYNQEGATV